MFGTLRYTLTSALLVSFFSSVLFSLPQFDGLRNLSIDVLTRVRWSTFGHLHLPSKSRAVVVAIDEETYNREPFMGTPTLTWTREVGRVLTGLIDGGAKVVGFDIIFPNSIEQSLIPFGEETVGARLRGFDRDYLRALAGAARENKLVLGRVQSQERPIVPSDAQRIAVGQQRNIRPLNVFTDPDGVVRRVPLEMNVDGQPTPSMSVELAVRASGMSADVGRGEVTIGTYRIPTGVPNTLTLNFDGGGDDIPTYSLADLRECLERGDTEYFRRHFADCVVLLGVLLDLEDRSLTSKRFATGVEGSGAERCALPRAPLERRIVRPSIAGVYIHATAVNNLLRQDALKELSSPAQWAINFAMAALASAAALAWSLPTAALTLLGVLVVWLAGATWLFASAVVLPLVPSAAASVLAFSLAIALRFVVTDKDKRLLRKSFSFYLSPVLIEKMLASSALPKLGGETRIVTLYRSDLAGFSSMSEKLQANELVPLMNEYLTAMTDIIGRYGGFVDKYIGDAIDGVFGAPVDDPAHAANAVRAALAAQTKLGELNQARLPTFRGYKLRQRIGLHTGSALVGNIGSQQRFNYTAMGDTANLASRLETANKFFGTSIIASDATVALVQGIVWRELDQVRVVGRLQPLTIFEPLAESGKERPTQVACADAYAEGLRRWRARDFAGAAEAFNRFAEVDPPASLFRARALKLALAPPDAGWSPINTLEGK